MMLIMRLFNAKIKSSLINGTALQSVAGQSLLLGLICFGVMFWFRYPGVWHWDDVALLKNIHRGIPGDLLLGRPGFMYPFILVWALVRSFGGSFYLTEDLIQMSNMIFMSGAYVLFFRILLRVSVPARTAFLTVILLLSELSLTIFASRPSDSPIMYFFILASYYFFMTAHQEKKSLHLFWSAFCFGYAFLAREPALFYFPFFVVALFMFNARKKLFGAKVYFSAAALWFFTCASVPLLLSFYMGSSYFENFYRTGAGYLPDIYGIFQKAGVAWESQINPYLLPAVFLGMFVFLKQNGLKKFTGFTVAFLLPVVFTYFVSGNDLLREARLFPGLFAWTALGLSYLITQGSELFVRSGVRTLVAVSAAALVSFVSAKRFLPQYREDVSKISQHQEFYERIKPFITGDVLLILGEETLYVIYRAQVDGYNPRFVGPGWSWPQGQLVDRISQALSQNLTVIYDPEGRRYMESKRAADLDKMAEAFQLTETKHGFIQVTAKK